MPPGIYKRFEGQRKKKGKLFPCGFCSKDVYVYPHKIKNINHYCSKTCSNRSTAKLYPKVKKGEIVSCNLCKKKIYRTPCTIKKNNYCSRNCSWRGTGSAISKATKGKIISEKTKEKLRQYKGEKASSWKGGRPKCADCKKQISYKSTWCDKCKVKHRTHKHQMKLNQAISDSRIGKMPLNMQRPGRFMNVQRGWFDINGTQLFFRSKWEANYALFLNFLIKQRQIKKWEYEKDIFIFEKIKFGTRSYRPDFKIFDNNGNIEYHEIKGWMDKKSKTKIKRMRIYYPKIKLIIIGRNEYDDLYKKLGKLLKFY